MLGGAPPRAIGRMLARQSFAVFKGEIKGRLHDRRHCFVRPCGLNGLVDSRADGFERDRGDLVFSVEGFEFGFIRIVKLAYAEEPLRQHKDAQRRRPVEALHCFENSVDRFRGNAELEKA